MLVKHLSAWDEFWGPGFKSPSGKNVVDADGINVVNLSKKYDNNCQALFLNKSQTQTPSPPQIKPYDEVLGAAQFTSV